MKLGRLGEFGAIELAASKCNRPGREVRVGIGDDAAAYRPGKGLQIVSADMMVEGVHFERAWTGFKDLGYKALASNLSDIAAMGGRPRYYLVSVALPAGADTKDLEGLYEGLEEAASPHGVRLIGGDTVGTPGPVVISVTIIGEASPKGPVKRSTARPGDDIYVTGTLGDSAAGLELLKAGAGKKAEPGGYAEYLIGRHRRPQARVMAGMLLGGSGYVSSMIDVSDGFSSDLGHILVESGVGAQVDESKLPISDALAGRFGRKKALGFALRGGEDYELIFTAPERYRKKLAALSGYAKVAFGMVGVITGDKDAFLLSEDGGRKALRPGGYEHFRK